MLQKLWPLLLILTSSFGATACNGNLPPRPEIDLGMVSAQPSPTPGAPEVFRGCIIAKTDGTVAYLTFEQCDKYVTIEPGQFQDMASYIIEVEKMAAKQGCKLNGPTVTQDLRTLLSRYALLLRR